MKGHADVILHLNKILYNELVAINQYFLHSKMYKDWGLVELAEHEYHESIDDVKVKTGCSSQCGKCLFRASKLVQDTLHGQQGGNGTSLLVASS